jgi:cupin fold WbuC family metalloprotein
VTISGFHRISLVDPDPELVREDAFAKSVAFFARVRPVWVDTVLYQELKRVSTIRGGKNVRLCLHSTPGDDQHDMIILIRRGTLHPPHRHGGTTETFHLVEGRLAVFSFDSSGDPAEVGVLRPGEVYRFSPDHFHTAMPLDDFVIYHESRIGPFLGTGDLIFPAWGPRAGDSAAMDRFADDCAALLGNNP